MPPLSTKQVAKVLGITEPRLQDLIRRDKITPPPMVGRARVWNESHVEAAREALARNS